MATIVRAIGKKFTNRANLRKIYTPMTTEALAYISAMTVAPDTARQTLINNAIVAMQDAGLWAKLKAGWFLRAHNEQASRINFKAPGAFTLTAQGTITFSTGATGGWVGDGATGYLDSGGTLGAMGAAQDSTAIAIACGSGTGSLFGGSVSTGNLTTASLTSGGGLSSRINQTTGADTGTNPSSGAGNVYLSRGSSTGYDRYFNGASIGSITTATSTGLPAVNFLLGRQASSYGTHPLFFAAVFSALTAQDVANLDAVINIYLAGAVS
jgi:hypothetical protein